MSTDDCTDVFESSRPGAWSMTLGDGPIIGAAIHAGHERSQAVVELQRAVEADRLREEDPYTNRLVGLAQSTIQVELSRFEVDFNRPRARCVYLVPAHAFGIELWHDRPPDAVLEAGRQLHDQFYADARRFFDTIAEQQGRFVVLDLHAYCHRRDGPEAPPAALEDNPEVNVGTGTVDRASFAGLVERLIADLGRCELDGRPLDVRENVRFRGGNFSSWINRTYRGRGCSLALELKKIFMDEWTGELDSDRFGALRDALASALPGLMEWLGENPSSLR